MATKKTNKTSKYKDIIYKSALIRSGSPAAYQLKPNKEELRNLTIMTVGEKNVNKTNRTILLVGETGAGKSTMVNVLVNYTMGVKWEDDIWFQIVEEEKKIQTESQTSDVVVYEIFGFEDKTLPYSLTIIDTPGFGSTTGTEHDETITERLLHLFGSEGGVHEVHAVGLVMKASDNRLNDRLLYICDSMMSLFGKDLERNIVALITHSDGTKPKNVLKTLEDAKMKCAKHENNQHIYYLFNNKHHEDRTEETEFLQHAYHISERGMREFTAILENIEPRKLKITIEVLIKRIRLTACIQNLQEKIELTELKQAEIRQIQEALKKHEEEIRKNENFTVEVEEVYKEKQNIREISFWGFFNGGATCCTVCEENCHYLCKRAKNPINCKVMKDGRCTVCTGKCPASDHVKEKRRYVKQTRKVQKTLEDVKKKHMKNRDESEKKFSLLENLDMKMKELTAEKSQLLDESYQHVVRLEQIALKADSVSTIVHLDFLIEKMKETGVTEKVQKLEEMRNKVDKGTRAAAQYMTKKT